MLIYVHILEGLCASTVNYRDKINMPTKKLLQLDPLPC